VVSTIEEADAIILSAGSFMTSIMPSLLVENIRDSINQSTAPLILVVNIKEESLGGDLVLTFTKQIELLQKAGIRSLDHILWPDNRALSTQDLAKYPIVQFDMKPCERGLHNEEVLKAAIFSVI
jgi:2-phospho-L-lactate transferase/gluconeogenesis factor (CofD/UPF0052 family)